MIDKNDSTDRLAMDLYRIYTKDAALFILKLGHLKQLNYHNLQHPCKQSFLVFT